MSLRLRVALVVIAVVAVVVVVVGERVYSAAETELVEEVDLELTGRASSFVRVGGDRALGDGFGRGDVNPRNGDRTDRTDPSDGTGNPFRDGVGQALDPRSILQQGLARDVFARLVDPDGVELLALGDFDVDLDAAAFPERAERPVLSDGSIDGGRARVITVPAGEIGFVQIARPLDEIDQSLADLRTRIVVISLLSIVVAGALAWFASGGTVRPIRRLTDAAENVAATGDLDQPVDGSGGAEVGRLARSFNAMLGALSESRRQQRQLVMDASHELRTPLASLRTNVDVLRSGREVPAEMRQAIVDDIGAEVDELTDLVAELVELATDVREDEAPVAVELAEIVAPVAERQARRTGREIRLDVRTTAVVDARPDAVGRAVRNLIENAAKFSPDETPITVVVDGASVTVVDEGPGIPPEDRDAVFDRFHRVESTRTMPGSGLGLAIVRQVAEAHGGTVVAGESAVGGAAVGFTLGTSD